MPSVPYSYYILFHKVDTFKDLKKVLQKNSYAWDSLDISTITKWVGSHWNRKIINDFKDVKINNNKLNNSIKYQGSDDRFYPVDCCKVYEKNSRYFIEIKYLDDWFQRLGGIWDEEMEKYLKYKTDTCEISGCGDILKSTCVVKEQKQ